MNFKWATDIHLNLFPHVRPLGDEWRSDQPLLISGDISSYHLLEDQLLDLKAGYWGPIYYVLGNHDYYNASWARTDKKMAKLRRGLVNLDTVSLVELGEYALVGQSGWYGGVGGELSHFYLNDFRAIEELACAGHREEMLDRIKARAESQAHKLWAKVEAAIESGHREIVVMTHVPPFVNAAWHEGRISDANALPWFSSPVMGVGLLALAERHDVRLLILCGHTHSPGECWVSENVRCITGKAVYRDPQLVGNFDLNAMFEGIEAGERLTAFPQSRGPG